MVASWPNWHRVEPFVRPQHSGSIHLKQGVHKLRYYHIGKKWQEISVAAIKLPNKKKFVVIPENFFLHVIKPEIIKIEKSGKQPAAEFTWKNTHYLRREKWELLTFQFADTSYSETDIVERKWDFGDGQTSDGENPSHTYLKPGLYHISLYIKNKRFFRI